MPGAVEHVGQLLLGIARGGVGGAPRIFPFARACESHCSSCWREAYFLYPAGVRLSFPSGRLLSSRGAKEGVLP